MYSLDSDNRTPHLTMSTEEENTTTPCPSRPVLLKLMGYPTGVNDNEYGQDEVKPDWEAVLEHLISNPAEASYVEDETYPLDDALWIENDPVPIDVIIRLLRINSKALTAATFEIANENPNTAPEVMRLLRGADVDSVHERSVLIQLMGFPLYTIDNDYDQDDVLPDWEAVRSRLVTHPEEASMKENDYYPLADAVWIENDPVPLDVVQSLLSLCTEGLNDLVFDKASSNPELDGEVLRLLFRVDRKILSETEESFVKL